MPSSDLTTQCMAFRWTYFRNRYGGKDSLATLVWGIVTRLANDEARVLSE